MHVLGIQIDNLSRRTIREKTLSFLEEPVYHRIATVNPEFLLLAEKDQSFRNSLEEADLRVADGVGLSFAFWLSGQKLLCRFPGADLMEEVLKIAAEKDLGIFLAIRQDGLSSYEEIRTALLKKYPSLHIEGNDIEISRLANYHLPPTHSSLSLPSMHSGSEPVEERAHPSESKTTHPLLLCNFGIPHQEIFLAQFKRNPSTIRLALGVGGSFDYLTGKLPRAPKFLRKVGLEWLWRFLLQPSKRAKRVWRSVIVFPIRVIFSKKKTTTMGG